LTFLDQNCQEKSRKVKKGQEIVLDQNCQEIVKKGQEIVKEKLAFFF
jgi:hypothetical protein